MGRALAHERTADCVVEVIDQAPQIALSEVRTPMGRLLEATWEN